MSGLYTLPGTGVRPSIQMTSGSVIDLLEPDPATILVSDIAHALANLCRFGGHVFEFYSVADHSMHVADIAVQLSGDESYRKAGLLHDAPEGILGCDIPTPLKRLPGLEYLITIQDIHSNAVADRFGLPHGFDHDQVIKKADVVAFAVEARDLMGDPAWATSQLSEEILALRDRQARIIPVAPAVSRDRFHKALLQLVK